jgi:methylmalonyl-CoA/ethylmalonyl-CoA epimerase
MTPDLTSANPASALYGATFDHIGVVVKTLEKGRSSLQQTMGISEWTAELEDPVNGVHVTFGRDASGVVYELLAPLDTHSPVQGALQGRKNLLNHVAYLVPNLGEAADRMRSFGCAPTADPKPGIAYGGQMIQFFVTPLNIIVELIEAHGHQHKFVQSVASTAFES